MSAMCLATDKIETVRVKVPADKRGAGKQKKAQSRTGEKALVVFDSLFLVSSWVLTEFLFLG